MPKLCSDKRAHFFDSQCTICSLLCYSNGTDNTSVLYRFSVRSQKCTFTNNAHVTLSRNRYQKPVPVSCRCIMQFDTNFFWHRNLVRVRALLYSMKETGVGVLVLVSGQCDMGLIPETSNCSTVVYIDNDGEACNQKVKAQG